MQNRIKWLRKLQCESKIFADGRKELKVKDFFILLGKTSEHADLMENV